MKQGKPLLIGCVADDFTGAGDAASFLSANGLKTLLTNGIPADSANLSGDFSAIVIALKSRTQETSQAIADSLAAFEWLKNQGAQTLYFNYCSTFDSTPSGNIGPVADAVLEKYDIPYTNLCPALPVNKRTVRDGILFVGDMPLSESHMKAHPLTPMWDSDITRLMAPQSKYPTYKITADLLPQPEKIIKIVQEYCQHSRHFYLCTDYFEPIHGKQIMAVFGDLPFLTGGSGLLTAFCRYKVSGDATAQQIPHHNVHGGRLLMAGSCSVTTRGQVLQYLESGGKGLKLSPYLLSIGQQTVEDAWKFLLQNKDDDVLVYSSGSMGNIECTSNNDAAVLEQTMATLATRAVQNGCTRLIVAGGETSGAVTQALGYTSFSICESVAPGVPVMVPTQNPNLHLVLKSGNFGPPDFFLTTLA